MTDSEQPMAGVKVRLESPYPRLIRGGASSRKDIFVGVMNGTVGRIEFHNKRSPNERVWVSFDNMDGVLVDVPMQWLKVYK